MFLEIGGKKSKELICVALMHARDRRISIRRDAQFSTSLIEYSLSLSLSLFLSLSLSLFLLAPPLIRIPRIYPDKVQRTGLKARSLGAIFMRLANIYSNSVTFSRHCSENIYIYCRIYIYLMIYICIMIYIYIYIPYANEFSTFG